MKASHLLICVALVAAAAVLVAVGVGAAAFIPAIGCMAMMVGMMWMMSGGRRGGSQ
jgi:hypothetical protein